MPGSTLFFSSLSEGMNWYNRFHQPEDFVKIMRKLMQIFPVVTVTILTLALGLAGCMTSPLAGNTPVAVTDTPSPTIAPVATTAAVSGALLTTKSLPEGITLTYPADWELQSGSGTAVRDYGGTTRNIANLYSPQITPDRTPPSEYNPDKSPYTSLSIDVEPEPVDNFEGYFHNASLSLGTRYLNYKITKHNYQLQVSITDDFSGYPAYQLNFDGDGVRGLYIFTNVHGMVYIFAFKNPSPYTEEVNAIIHSIRISP